MEPEERTTVQDQISGTPAGNAGQGRRQRSGERLRRQRSDYGSFRATERDSELLSLIGEQYAITLPQLARLIRRRLHTARALRDRWKRAGWIDSRPLAVDAPSFVWLTGRGRSLAQSPYRTWDANPGLALHIEAVTNVRLLLERELELGEWECERSLAQRFARDHGSRSHLPDGLLRSDQRIAVEVELTLKSRVRLQAIIDELSLAYDQVWYFAPERLQPILTELASAAPFGNVFVHHYPPLAAEVARQAP